METTPINVLVSFTKVVYYIRLLYFDDKPNISVLIKKANTMLSINVFIHVL